MNFNPLKLENQLCFPLYACSKEVIKKYKPFLDQVGLTYTQYITMLVLWEKKSINVKTLGQHLFLDSGTLTPVLRKLETDGLVTRERSSADERNLVVSLTQKGEALRDDVIDIPQKVQNCINLSDKEAMTLYRLLHKILGQV